MACGGCGGGGGRHSGTGDLTRFAYLTPRQIKYLQSIGKLPKNIEPSQEKK